MAGWFEGGAWEGLFMDAGDDIQFNLCNAVNERETVIGKALSTFWPGTGAKKAEPTLADFADMPMYDLSGASRISLNVGLLQTAIADLIELSFLSEPGGSGNTLATYVSADRNKLSTLSDLLNLGSYGSSWIEVDSNVLNTNIWLQIQETLNNLTHVVWLPAYVVGRSVDIRQDDAPVFPWNDAVAEALWDSARADTPTDTEIAPLHAHVAWFHIASPRTIQLVGPSMEFDLYTTPLIGTLEKGIVCVNGSFEDGALDQSVEFEHVETNDIYTHVPNTPIPITETDQGANWPNIGSNTTMTLRINTSEPADKPSNPATSPFSTLISMRVTPAPFGANFVNITRAYTDVTSEFVYSP